MKMLKHIQHCLVTGDKVQPPQGLVPIVQQGSGKDIRDHFRDFYVSNEGSVPWQWDMI